MECGEGKVGMAGSIIIHICIAGCDQAKGQD